MKIHILIKIFLTLCFISVSIIGFSQDFLWVKSMGGSGDDAGRSIVLDANGNVYSTGIFEGTVDFDPGSGTYNLTSSGNFDIYISKLDSLGNFLWAKQMGGTSYDESSSIALDSAGNIYTTGNFFGKADFDPDTSTSYLTSSGNEDIFISKLDSSGKFLWVKQMGGTGIDAAFSIVIDILGNIYTVGHFMNTVDFNPGVFTNNLTSVGSLDIFICKLNSLGNFVWAKSMGGVNSDHCYSLKPDLLGNIYITGNFLGKADFDPSGSIYNLTSVGSYDFFICKLTSSGNFAWAKSMGGSDYDNTVSINLDSFGNIYTSGYFEGTADFNPDTSISFNLSSNGKYDVFICKLDSSGNFLWAKSFGGKDNDLGNTTLDELGNIFTSGRFEGTADFDPGNGNYNLTSEGNFDIFISKLDSSGDFLWAIDMGGSGNDFTLPIVINASGDVYITGAYSGKADFDPDTNTFNLTSAGSYDFFVSKYYRCKKENLTDSINACNSYKWRNGITYSKSQSGVKYTVLGVTAGGCDSVYTLKLTITDTTTENITMCDSYTWRDGKTYTTSQLGIIYLVKGATPHGCDSVYMLNLTINNKAVVIDTILACNNYKWRNGKTYTSSQSGIIYTVSGATIQGCDSVYILNLTIHKNDTITENIKSCETYTWRNGITYTTSQSGLAYTIPGATLNGCDSVYILNLTINKNETVIENITECNSFIWRNGITYTSSQSGVIYTVAGVTTHGCDSIYTLELTINKNTTGTDTQTACNAYTWVDGNTYYVNNNTATFNINGGASNGCDSIVTLDLTITKVSDITTSISGSTLTANNNAATYVWLDCDNNYSPISGETNQSFTAKTNGNYAVELTENSCVDTSICVVVNNAGIIINQILNWNIYPNPTSDNVRLEFQNEVGYLIVSDVAGKQIWKGEVRQNQIVSLKDYDSGIYFFQLTTQNQTGIKKVMKQ